LVQGNKVAEYEGNLFQNPSATGKQFELSELKLLMPCQPSKVVALWNNFKALGEKLQLDTPVEPLYFLKAPNAWLNPGEDIVRPSQEGKIVYEGELAIVIGKLAKNLRESEAMAHVFGYTCANDVTHADILNRDKSFAQWVRAKGFDTFCPFGPYLATGLDPQALSVMTRLNGEQRQHFPISDMRFNVAQLVSKISQDMTLVPGDIILCGTSIGVGSMKPGSTVEIDIPGIGCLSNRFV
jgi:2-keto-4-pentenoate hydratase/2-oxohepta-3-ene-1,7-dioic acid hydratase in catechol pathway